MSNTQAPPETGYPAPGTMPPPGQYEPSNIEYGNPYGPVFPPAPQQQNPTNPAQQPTNTPQGNQYQYPPITGLPPTGLQQQLQSLRQQYDFYGEYGYRAPVGQYMRRVRDIGYDPRWRGHEQQTALPSMIESERGSTSLNELAKRLARNYGLAVGRDDLVDSLGNFNFTPDQLAEASGGAETAGSAAAKMNYISAAIARYQEEQKYKQAEATVMSGLGLVNQRRTGSMISQQAPFYQQLGALYAQQAASVEALDFSYYIYKEREAIEDEVRRRAERKMRKMAQSQFWAGIAITALGVVSGNVGVAGQGIAMAGTSGEQAGYW